MLIALILLYRVLIATWFLPHTRSQRSTKAKPGHIFDSSVGETQGAVTYNDFSLPTGSEFVLVQTDQELLALQDRSDFL
jgi:hypothetical protein